jgi:hypothetical protein
MPGPRRHLIRSVSFAMDGTAVVEYIDPATDLKENGVALNKALFVPDSTDYADGIEAVHEAAEILVDDVLEDMDTLGPPTSLPKESDEDEDDDKDEEPHAPWNQ